jgi:hypothetical protein
MKKIKSIHFKFLRAGEHYEYLMLFKNRLDATPVVKAIVVAWYGDFVVLLDKEGALILAMKKSDYTVRIADADLRVDRCIVGMQSVIGAAMHHFDPAVVEAAKSLYNRFHSFGSLTRKNYEEETGIVSLLIVDLKSSEYAPKVTLVGLTAWVAELDDAERAFELLMAQRGDEYDSKPQGSMSNVRHEIGEIYYRMTDRISAAALMSEQPAEIEAFISRLNVDIDYVNEHNYHHAKKHLSDPGACVIETIETQQYAGGKAITPLPKAFYCEEGKQAVEIVFAKDYSVTYKNNTEVGMAEITLHGKGGYRGQKTTTFNIAR